MVTQLQQCFLMISVIIPAHNEENVIAKTLEALLPGITAGELEVIVICNGCSDKTASVARKVSTQIKCVESIIASKTHALNLGDEVANSFPRVYLDADVVLSLSSLKKLAGVLQQGHYLAASPTMRMKYNNTSWLVKSYYQVWKQLPYVKEGMIGTGVYALSEKGRERFQKFPDIIADDGFVRALFNDKERISVADCYSMVRAPLNVAGLLKIKTRSRLGRYELVKKFPELLKNEPKNYWVAILALLREPRIWIKIPVYVYVNLVSRKRARKCYRNNRFSGWERDETSRKSTISSVSS